jgi:hypothetical protein
MGMRLDWLLVAIVCVVVAIGLGIIVACVDNWPDRR